MKYNPIIFVASLLLWLAAGSSQAFADTYTVSDSPAIHDHGDPNRPGSLQWTLNRAGSAPATVVLPGDAEYRIGAPGARRDVVVRTNINLVFRHGAVITFGNTNSSLKIFGSIDAGLLKLFNAAPGQVRFQGYDPDAGSSSPLKYRRAVIKEVYPQWWGAINQADFDPAKNLRAFRAAFLAFPTRVSIPAGIYTLSDEWRLDFREIPEIPNASEFLTSFEVAGAGRDSAVLIQAANSQSPQFVGIYGDYPTRTWASGKFYGLKLLNPKGTGLKVQNPRIHVSDLHIGVVPAGGAGIELMANSIGCHFEHIFLSGPATFLGPFPPNPAFDPAASTLASGFKCAGGNVQDIVISRLNASTFDIGINLFGRDGGIVGWKILNCDLSGNQIGINFRGSNIVNSAEIIGTYMEMWPADGAYGIRLDPVAPPLFVRIEGGRIDPKGPNARPIEIHGIYHIVDVQYAGDVYGTLGTGTQIRMGEYRGR
jgi:hypothetical protein